MDKLESFPRVIRFLNKVLFFAAFVCLILPADLSAMGLDEEDTTVCTPVSVPVLYDFDDEVSNTMPACWQSYYYGTDSTRAPRVSANFAPVGKALLLSAGDTTACGTTVYVALPQVANTLTDLQLSFVTRMENDTLGRLALGYVTVENDIVQYVVLEQVASSMLSVSHSFSLRGYSFPSGAQLAFRWTNIDTCASCAIDSVSLDSLDLCLSPVIRNVSVLSNTSLLVEWEKGWNEQMWFIEYGPSGFTSGNGTQRLVYSTSFVAEELASSTVYDFYVKGICNSGTATPWSARYSAATPCQAITLPYYENFESYTSAAYNEVGVMPSCWGHYSIGDPSATNYEKFRPHVSTYNLSSNQGLLIQSNVTPAYGNRNYAILPWFASDLNGTKISFSSAMQYTSINMGMLYLGYFTNILDESTFVVLQSFSNTTALTDHEYSLYHSGIPAGSRLAFLWKRETTTDWWSSCSIDNIAVEFLPCAPVSNVQVSDVMMREALVTWTRGADENAWQVEYGPEGFALGNGRVVDALDTSLRLTGLTGGQSYDVYVRAMCDPLNPSPAVGPVNFTPYCSVIGDTAVVVDCDSFVWQGRTITESGFYVDTLPQAAAYFCDSIIALDLTLYHSYNQYETVNVCQNDLPVQWRDVHFDVGSTTMDTVIERSSVNHCDSIIYLHLEVYPAFEHVEYDTICQQALPYTWRDTVFDMGTESGEYVFVRHSEYGCDSLVTLHLTVYPNYYPTEISQICQEELPYRWRDTTFAVGTQSGVFTFHRQTVNGCDSVVSLVLIVHPSYEEEIALDLCRSELPFAWRDTVFAADAQSGVVEYHLHTAFGCDSTVRLTLNIYEEEYQEETVDLCIDELPYVYQDTVFRVGSQSGTYSFYRYGAGNCVQTSVLHLNIYPTYYQEVSRNVCDSDFPMRLCDSIFLDGTESGVYTFAKTTRSGCDSITVLYLTVNRTYEQYETLDICKGDLPYRWRDTVFLLNTRSGDFHFQRVTSKGCDSVVHLTLNVHQAYGSTESLVVCENELPVEWRGHVIPRGTTSGTIIYDERSIYGCDSIVTLRITVNPTSRETVELSICENDLPYVWRDTLFEQGCTGGTYLFERQSRMGCDSVVILKLTVHPAAYSEATVELCENDFPYTWLDTVFQSGTQSGIYTHRDVTPFGCESVSVLQLTVHSISMEQEEVAVCANDLPFVWRDTVFAEGTQSGEYTFARRNASGCDSVVALFLTVMPSQTELKEVEICEDEFPYVTPDTIFPVGTRSGEYVIHYPSSQGCDSVVTIRLTVHPRYEGMVSEIICANDLPYTWRDTVFEVGSQSGVYQFTRSSQYGCDSLTSLALIVHPSYDQYEYVDVCEDDFPFFWRDTTFFQGTRSGDYVFQRSSIHGCDSIVTLHVEVHPVYQQYEALSVCQSDLPYTWRDTTFGVDAVSAIITFRRQTVFGCDSIVNLMLSILPTSVQRHTETVCINDLPFHSHYVDTTFEEGTVSGSYFFHYLNQSGCDSNVIVDLVVNPEYEMEDELVLCSNDLPYYYAAGSWMIPIGTTSQDRVFPFYTMAGCDSILTLHLTVNPSYDERVAVNVCANDFPFTWRDTIFDEGTLSGSFTFHRTSTAGCDSVVTLTLFVQPQPSVFINGPSSIYLGDTTVLVATASNCTFLWSDGSTTRDITIHPDSTTTYCVTVTNVVGCSNTECHEVEVNDTSGINVAERIVHQIVMYPNPTAGRFTLKAEQEVISEVEVFDLMGRCVRRITVGDRIAELDLTGEAPGTYVVRMRLQQGDVLRKKLILK
ncbi:MAG: T9SS type A sorting domain-containing protein [Bacteroidales bacterium]|nr:T9SS type A sorting domain-containing protein [Bacteroidales bacterium]